MKCLYCDKEIEDTFKSLFIKENILCYKCNDKLRMQRKIIFLDEIKIETFYDYDSLFKNLLLQFKECYDEALKDVFIYPFKEYLKIRYRGYKILYAPSSKEKLKKRGFMHLKLIFESLNLKEVKGLKMKEEIIQEGKSYDQRRKIIGNYCYIGNKLDKVLIVDDVLTTGSTIKGIYNTMKPHCKKISVVVLARK